MTKFLRAKRWLPLLVIGLVAGAAPAQQPAAPAAKPPLAAPEAQPRKAGPPPGGTNILAAGTVTNHVPIPARRETLPAAFAKTAPASVADLKAIEQRVKALVARVSPAVVAVQVGFGSGSGVIITPDGLVLTAGHVCGEPNREVKFTFADGKTARGKTLGVNGESDSGLMKITDRGPWPCAPMGDLDQARIGDWVLAMGHPGGFDISRSLVVRLGRIIQMGAGILQSDCTISPGDSGGPLFDMSGRVIGIHSAISTSLAENFHVPVTQFYQSWDQLVAGTRSSATASPPRAYVGARLEAAEGGCRLSAIETNSPAAKAGLEVGDVVLKVDGREIMAPASFQRWVAEAMPGETLNLEIKRANRRLTILVKVEAPHHH